MKQIVEWSWRGSENFRMKLHLEIWNLFISVINEMKRFINSMQWFLLKFIMKLIHQQIETKSLINTFICWNEIHYFHYLNNQDLSIDPFHYLNERFFIQLTEYANTTSFVVWKDSLNFIISKKQFFMQWNCEISF